MKKLTTALLTALLLLNLAACGEKEPDDTPSGYDDSLISELYSEEGEYTDAENNTLAYSYHVPRIVSETAVAAALNDEIADQFGALVQEQKNMMASRVSLTCLSVTWTSYWNDSLLPRGARRDGRRHEHDGDVQLRLFRRQAADERGSAGALRAFNAGLRYGGAPHRGKLL